MSDKLDRVQIKTIKHINIYSVYFISCQIGQTN